MTLWVCSTDNLGRSPEQVAGILAAIEDKMQALATDPQVHAHRIRVRAIGASCSFRRARRRASAPPKRRRPNDGLLLSIAVAYGGREEIADAMRTMLSTAAEAGRTLAEAVAAVSEAIARHLPRRAPELTHHSHERRGAALGLPAVAKRE